MLRSFIELVSNLCAMMAGWLAEWAARCVCVWQLFVYDVDDDLKNKKQNTKNQMNQTITREEERPQRTENDRKYFRQKQCVCIYIYLHAKSRFGLSQFQELLNWYTNGKNKLYECAIYKYQLVYKYTYLVLQNEVHGTHSVRSLCLLCILVELYLFCSFTRFC